MSFSENQQIHMVGVCGVGMAGVARLLAHRGHVVSGCDSQLNELSSALRSAGVKLYEGHSADHMKDLPEKSVIVVTPAVSADEPELVAARKRGIPVIRRGEVLASLVSQSTGIAVCGTHGKTTTSCFVVRLFQELGADPGWCIGGFTTGLGGVADPGDNDLLVVEADESDGTLRHYHPVVTVVNNIDIDHLEHFDGEDDLLECFRDVVRQTRSAVCVCADDERALRVVRDCGVDALAYGLSAEATLKAVNVESVAGSSSFDLVYRRQHIGRVSIGVGGVHNIVNALGAVAAALSSGYSVEELVCALPAACSELPGRRFEFLGERDGVCYVADYAHHPVELRAAVQMALDYQPDRVVAVFQPHRYTRTLAMGMDFPPAFEGVDEVVLLPVYAASEAPLEGGDICDLYAHFRKELGGPVVTLCRSLAECGLYLERTVKNGDLVLIAGAGDVINLRSLLAEDVHCVYLERLVEELRGYSGVKASLNVNLQPYSIFPTRGVGMVVEVVDKKAVAAAVALCRKYGVEWRPAGAGFNTFISDCGMDSCLLHFSARSVSAYGYAVTRTESRPPTLRSLSDTTGVDENCDICVSCIMNGTKLLDELRKAGLSGLEFMTGIPGSVGGWLAMNAGAHGGCISDCVESVEFVNADGEIVELPARECGFSYRNCDVVRAGFALSCRLRLQKSSSEFVKSTMDRFRDKRIPLAGLRTAGSVFRNPPGDHAGRLLDEAGCKSLRIGGAYVADFHANIIVAGDGCTASDVLALTQMMRNRVKFRFDVDLHCEMRGI